jgi:hypothetical protein
VPDREPSPLLRAVATRVAGERAWALGTAHTLTLVADWVDRLGEDLGDLVGLAYADGAVGEENEPGLDAERATEIRDSREAAVDEVAQRAEVLRGEARVQEAFAAGAASAFGILCGHLGLTTADATRLLGEDVSLGEHSSAAVALADRRGPQQRPGRTPAIDRTHGGSG